MNLRRCLAFVILVLPAAGVLAAPAWLSTNFGARLGGGLEEFSGGYHAETMDFTNLYSVLGEPNLSRSGSPNLGMGIYAGAGWRHILELRTELLYSLDSSQSSEDYGFGIVREVQYDRESVEVPLLLRLGWPLGHGLHPYVDAGLWGNRVIGAQVHDGQEGFTQVVSDWKGTPNEDWGWCAGFGLDWAFNRGYGMGLEARFRQGEKDLDPEGNFEQKVQGWSLILNLGI